MKPLSRKSVLIVLALAGLATLAYSAYGRVRSEVRLQPLMAQPERARRGGPAWNTEAERLAFYRERAGRGALWQARRYQDITVPVAQLLNHRDWGIRTRAARALGRLETPGAEAALTTLARQIETSGGSFPSEPASKLTVALALARVRSRNMSGVGRVDAVLRSVALNRQDLAVLSARLTAQSGRHAGSPGQEVLNEVVDLLYTMARRGDLVSPQSLGLTLPPAQRLMLTGAQLPPAAEIDMELDYLANITILGIADDLLVRHLVDLGPEVQPKVLARITQVRRGAAAYKGGRGYLALFRVASRTGNREVLPLLREIEEEASTALSRKGWTGRYAPRWGADPDYWLWSNTSSVRRRLEEGLEGVDLP